MNEIEHLNGVIDFQNKVIKLLNEMTTIQEETLKYINRVMFEETKRQRLLSKDEQNEELLYITWGANDIISDNPRLRAIQKELEELYKPE